ncbi:MULTISPECIES: hypothetical protein [Rhodococcus]|uniref:Uncharacterized protein n=2 Tax=Rhodococcus opacus TaxID=37919 RepID=C1BDC9_RHOOB|nr:MULTISPECIES: hypothetical protein [Rhodococcus]EID79995.1 hypothetical protein W59_10379 [Rhodococcus opacus RKJ300 = JCM 13270]KAF0965568.1 hypothetical protein MLGJGCBP_01266 [Rhodococcus sp. T7]QQZ18193.1 hypothetical protein GO592_38625 [Rhodococcus sp. 21391]UOT08109.1 hypothetical protein MPY17_37720 [Rhodococcus opacus]BAH55873.1 hypothetical protein ROP_pROB01-03740 [Rhodococcus opacus B4]
MYENEIHERRLCGDRRQWHGTTVLCTADKWHPGRHRAMAIDAAGHLTTLCTWTDLNAPGHDLAA